jgi:hypothetical protein
MEASVRPHRGGIVLGLGIFGLVSALVLLPVGIVAWILGSKELRGMNAGVVDPSGRTVAQLGWAFGIVGTFLPIPVAGLAFVLLGWYGEGLSIISDSRHPEFQQVQVTYSANAGTPNARAIKYEYREKRHVDGTWEKDGDFVYKSPDGKRLEEGQYTDGRRTGPWTFWNDDGSVDHVKSGVYENDVKVRD